MNVKEYNEIIFKDIRHIDENGNEYWLARELQEVLNYKEWRKFNSVIKKAKSTCDNSKINIFKHFGDADKLSMRANNAIIPIKDYKLSRYACYLIVQNSDPRKEVIALGQTYFAIQTRKQELFEEEYNDLTEIEKRLYNRKITRKENHQLNQVVKNCGVKNFGEFHNAGYKGLYNGETANDIFKRKGLKYREDILDNMGSDELATNIFRISQTKQKIENEKISGQFNAEITHYQVGKKVRRTIEELGGTMPEKLPRPNKSLKELKGNKSIK